MVLKKYSKKGLEKRKLERECLPEFFQKHMKLAKGAFCQECGSRLTGNVSEIAHILPKSYFKSIMCNDLNVIYLCGMYSENQCHSKYDNSAKEKIKEMKIYNKAVEVFNTLKEEITETLNYKLTEKYE